MARNRAAGATLAALCLSAVFPAHAGAQWGQEASAQDDRPALSLDLPSMDEARAADASRTGTPASAREIEAARVAEEARAAAEAEAARVRAANAAGLVAAEAESRRIAASREAQLAQYREQQRLHQEALADYADRIAAAEEARKRWQADVAACQAGDYSRCGGAPAVQ